VTGRSGTLIFPGWMPSCGSVFGLAAREKPLEYEYCVRLRLRRQSTKLARGGGSTANKCFADLNCATLLVILTLSTALEFR
jgi:hypothetical protein